RIELWLLPLGAQPVAAGSRSAVEQHNARDVARPGETWKNERRSRLPLEDQEMFAPPLQPRDPFVSDRLLPSLRAAERARHFFDRRHADRVEMEAGDVRQASRCESFDSGRLAGARCADHEQDVLPLHRFCRPWAKGLGYRVYGIGFRVDGIWFRYRV